MTGIGQLDKTWREDKWTWTMGSNTIRLTLECTIEDCIIGRNNEPIRNEWNKTLTKRERVISWTWYNNPAKKRKKPTIFSVFDCRQQKLKFGGSSSCIGIGNITSTYNTLVHKPDAIYWNRNWNKTNELVNKQTNVAPRCKFKQNQLIGKDRVRIGDWTLLTFNWCRQTRLLSRPPPPPSSLSMFHVSSNKVDNLQPLLNKRLKQLKV